MSGDAGWEGRPVLGVFVGRGAGDSRGLFELADGRRVEAEGPVGFDAAEAPRLGEKALLMVDENGEVLRWEPYPAGRPPRPTDSR